MRRAGLLFGAGLLVGAIAMYVVRGDNAGSRDSCRHLR